MDGSCPCSWNGDCAKHGNIGTPKKYIKNIKEVPIVDIVERQEKIKDDLIKCKEDEINDNSPKTLNFITNLFKNSFSKQPKTSQRVKKTKTVEKNVKKE